MIRTPQEQELLAIFRQLNGPAQEAAMRELRDKRDALERQAERDAEGRGHIKLPSAPLPNRERDWHFQAFLARASGRAH